MKLLNHLKEIDSFFKSLKDLDIELPDTFNGSTDIAGRNRELIFELSKDVEDDPIYQELLAYEGIITQLPKKVQQLFREMPLDRQVNFMRANPDGSDYELDDRVIIEQLSEPFGKGSRGGVIKMVIDGEQTAVSYYNDEEVGMETWFDDQDTADSYLASLMKKYPECKAVTKFN